MNITIILDSSRLELLGSSGAGIIEKLYLIAIDFNNTLTLEGNIISTNAYGYLVDYLNTNYGPNFIVNATNRYIHFEDPNMESYLASMGIGTDGKVTEAQAAAVTVIANGQYFSWGNIEGYVASYNEGDYSGEIVGYSFILDNYVLTNGYQLSGSISVENDAAVDIMGGKWSIPTDVLFLELIDNCTITWVEKNGVPGKLFTSNINGKTLFIINNGYGNATTLDSPMYLSAYWTNAEDDVDTSKALSFTLGTSILPNLTPVHPEEKRFGFGIRAVKSSV